MELDTITQGENPRLCVVARFPTFGEMGIGLEGVVKLDQRFIHRALRRHDVEVVLRQSRVQAVLCQGVAERNSQGTASRLPCGNRRPAPH